MNNFLSIGIDVSKMKIDAFIHQTQEYSLFTNNHSGFRDLIKWIQSATQNPQSSWLICFEHTGLYSFPLAVFLSTQQINYCMIASLEIKRSMGIKRGKSDKLDAKAIARYVYLYREELTPSRITSKTLLKIKQLQTLRNKLVKQRASHKSSMKEQQMFLDNWVDPSLFQVQKKVINMMTEQIKEAESQMLALIEEDEDIAECFNLLISIKGIGPVLALSLICSTDGFSRFQNWRQFACYCGIAPFEHQSGSSLKSPKRVHHLGNKRIKTLLNLAAWSAIQSNPEMKHYYENRLLMGKSKMSTINIIRNKLIARAFAVVKRRTPYVQTMNFAA